MDPQAAERLKALWKSGHDKYKSFFAVLAEVRNEIGDEALPNWCYYNLGIGMSAIAAASKILFGIDAEKAKKELAAAKKAETEEKRKVREEAARQRELEKAARNRCKSSNVDEITCLRNEIKRLNEALEAARSGAMERRCEHCNQPFTAQNPAAKYCSGRCRVAAHRAKLL